MKKALLLFQLLLLTSLWLSSNAQGKLEALEDERDGQHYIVVTIGEQTWMAENLNYGEAQKTCYDNNPTNCDLYGGLYTWEVAQEICPAGWHLPVKEEWDKLAEDLGTADAGQKIKAAPGDPLPWDRSNESGFSALPAGAGNGEGFHRKDNWALFWSATTYNEERAWFAQLDGFWYEQPPKYKNIYIGWYYLKTNEFSVRCVKGLN